MRKMKLLSSISALVGLGASSTFAGGDNLGDFMLGHIADSREVWHFFPKYGHLDLRGEWLIGGINFYPSLHTIMLILSIIVLVPLLKMATTRKNKVPTSRWGHAVEALVSFIREDLVIPNIGKKHGAKWLPFACTIFFFILTLNLFGLIPGMSTVTANPNFTGVMALMVFIVFNIAGMINNGPINYIKNLVPHGVPAPIVIILFPIELIGLLTKSVALGIRLFANMSAGHFIILSLLGLIGMLKTIYVAPGSIAFALFIYSIEVLVSFLQAYVFTLLTTLFVGSAITQDH
jgi:F-type H+-transporting ATPase subunit a